MAEVPLKEHVEVKAGSPGAILRHKVTWEEFALPGGRAVEWQLGFDEQEEPFVHAEGQESIWCCEALQKVLLKDEEGEYFVATGPQP